MNPQEPAVIWTDASVTLGRRTLFRHVDLTIPTGSFVAILGPNGVGKSTLIKTVLGLQQLSEGSVSVFGGSPEEARPLIGYLPQRHHFESSVSISGRDLVRLGLDGDRWGMPLPFANRFSATARAKSAQVDAVLEQVGATSYADRSVGACSGGEQQRLLIAQALVRQPKLLVLDEPLDSLDLPNQVAVAELIATISKVHGVTVLLVAHDVNPILSHLDQVVYLAHGGVLTGSPNEVITSENLSALYDTPVDVLTTSTGRLVVVGQPDAHGGHHPHPGHGSHNHGHTG